MSFLLNPFIYAAAAPSCTYISSTNLVSHWPMDGDSTDTVGGFNGTDTNITYGSPFVFSQSAGFNSASPSYQDMGNSLSLQAAVFSVSCWVYVSAINSAQAIIENYGTVSNGPYRLYINGTNSTFFASIGNTDVVFTTGIASANTWMHVVLTRSSATVAKFYVNGTEYNYGSSTSRTSATSRFVIGSRWNNTGSNYPDSYLNGNVEDVAYFSRALTAAEVTQIYTGGTVTGCRISNP